MPAKITLTRKQKHWLRTHFPDTTNEVCAATLGMSEATLHRFARKMGLKKSAEHIRKWSEIGCKLGRETNRRNGYPPKGFRIPNSPRFKKGENLIERIGKERWAEACRKRRETYKKTLQAERRRVLFGLEQKTKLRITKQSRSKTNYRLNMRKKGYIETKTDKNILFYVSEAMRHPLAERHAGKYGIKILPIKRQAS